MELLQVPNRDFNEKHVLIDVGELNLKIE